MGRRRQCRRRSIGSPTLRQALGLLLEQGGGSTRRLGPTHLPALPGTARAHPADRQLPGFSVRCRTASSVQALRCRGTATVERAGGGRHHRGAVRIALATDRDARGAEAVARCSSADPDRLPTDARALLLGGGLGRRDRRGARGSSRHGQEPPQPCAGDAQGCAGIAGCFVRASPNDNGQPRPVGPFASTRASSRGTGLIPAAHTTRMSRLRRR